MNASPVRALLGALAARHHAALSLTYSLTFVENLCRVLLPFTIGLAVDALLANRPHALTPMLIVWLLHLAVGRARHWLDTNLFTRIYGEMSVDLVERQRAGGIAADIVAARVALAREFIDFLETEMPQTVKAAVLLIGAVGMLFFIDRLAGAVALAALLPLLLINRRFLIESLRLHAGLNNRLEREIGFVTAAPVPAVRRHYERTRRWRLRLSHAEARAWGAIELIMLGLFSAVLVRLAGIEGMTAGGIFAALAYVWDYYDAAEDLPNVLQNIARIADIADRVAAEGDPRAAADSRTPGD